MKKISNITNFMNFDAFKSDNRNQMNTLIKGYGEVTAIDCGRFSTVYKAQELSTKITFAIKSISLTSRSNDSIAPYREIQALSVCEHQNIVKLHEVVQSASAINLVMEYIPYNLSKVLSSNIVSESLAKGFILQLFRGLAHMHSLGMIHRDIKPQNLLVTKQGVLKICDLGLCRLLTDHSNQQGYDDSHAWTLQVGTHYYRSPELLYGDRNYGYPIDIWAAGCVMAEILTGSPLFPGTGDVELLAMISDLLGDASEKNWPGISQLSDFGKICFKEKPAKDFHEIFQSLSEEAIDLLQKIIVYDPAKRISAAEALKHPWFRTDPAPIIAPFDGQSFDILQHSYI